MMTLANEIWWTNTQAGMIGGVGGSICGVLGGVIGIMVPMFANRGKAHDVVYGMFTGMIVLGICSLTLGVIALLNDQPYHVWYPGLLLGFLLTIIPSSLLPVVVIRYHHAEQRRMEADLLRGDVSRHASVNKSQASLIGIMGFALITVLVTTGTSYGVILIFSSST